MQVGVAMTADGARVLGKCESEPKHRKVLAPEARWCVLHQCNEAALVVRKAR